MTVAATLSGERQWQPACKMPAVDPLRSAQIVDVFVLEHRGAVAASLRASYRSSLARAVENLPEGALVVRDIAKSDLKVCIEAYALAEAALCAVHLRACNFIAAVQSADAALIVLGVPLGAALRTAADEVLNLAREAHEDYLSNTLENVQIFEQPKTESKYPQCSTVTDPSVSDFKMRFFNKDEPVLLKGAASHWPAVNLWRRPAFLDRLCGFRIVPVELTKKGSTTPPREECVSLQRVLEAMHGAGNTKSGLQKEIMYLAQHPIFDYMGELQEHIMTPQYVQAGGGKEANLINVWMGSESSGTRLHYDSTDNLLVQVVGWKRIVLFPPSETPKLYCNAKEDNFSPVDVDNINMEIHPNFLSAKGISVVLGPGDILYMPAGHWHWVRAMTPSISVNFWF